MVDIYPPTDATDVPTTAEIHTIFQIAFPDKNTSELYDMERAFQGAINKNTQFSIVRRNVITERDTYKRWAANLSHVVEMVKKAVE